MKRAIRFAAIGFLFAVFGGFATAATITINANGTGGAAIPVGTSTPVTIISAGSDSDFCFSSEGADMRCVPGGMNGSAPSPTPDQTHGFLVPYVKGGAWCEKGENAQRRWDCIAIGGAGTSVDTVEEQP